MLTVFDCWTSYIHWGKVHNFFIICISPLIHSGYDPFCQDSYMLMFFITSDFFTSAILHWEKWFEYLYLWLMCRTEMVLTFRTFTSRLSEPER